MLAVFVALLTALTFMVLQLWTAPYRDESDAFLGAVSATALVLVLITTSFLQAGAHGAIFAANQLPFFVPILSVAALSLLVAFLLQFWHRCRIALHLPVSHWRSDSSITIPSRKTVGQFHVFVSHQWGTGQDQARSIKDGLLNIAPGLSCFLDVDDLTSISELEALVDASETIVVFLSGSMRNGAERSDYFHSANCPRELRHAVARRKPIVLVYETDRQHGGCSLESHRRDCPADLQHLLEPGASAAPTLVPWLRVREFRQQSLLQILAVVLRLERPDDTLYIPQSVLEEPVRTLTLSANTDFKYHLYASPFNAGAASIATLLVDEARSTAGVLHVCSDPAQRARCHTFLLFLDGALFDEGADRLEAELSDALQRSMPLLLIHEQRPGPRHRPIDFDQVIERTPRQLRLAGVYSNTATPLYDHPEHLAIGLRLALRQVDGRKETQEEAGDVVRQVGYAAADGAASVARVAMNVTSAASGWIIAQIARWRHRRHKYLLDDRPGVELLDGPRVL